MYIDSIFIYEVKAIKKYAQLYYAFITLLLLNTYIENAKM